MQYFLYLPVRLPASNCLCSFNTTWAVPLLSQKVLYNISGAFLHLPRNEGFSELLVSSASQVCFGKIWTPYAINSKMQSQHFSIFLFSGSKLRGEKHLLEDLGFSALCSLPTCIPLYKETFFFCFLTALKTPRWQEGPPLPM